MRVLFSEFTAAAEKKIESIMMEPSVSVYFNYIPLVKPALTIKVFRSAPYRNLYNEERTRDLINY